MRTIEHEHTMPTEGIPWADLAGPSFEFAADESLELEVATLDRASFIDATGDGDALDPECQPVGLGGFRVTIR